MNPTSEENKWTEKRKPSTKTPSPSSSDGSTSTERTKNGALKKKEEVNIPDYSDDKSLVNDGVDYTLEENYAVKKFIAHVETNIKKKGKQMKLITSWKGWRDKKSITMEPLENMVEDWPDEVKKYYEKSQEIEDICHSKYSHLFE